ncbi:hypothetical protein CAMGR0001_1272 [Campylobacter gracilis RM3268]|uniref:Uncharacterized protein n=1 Tax=Campylobacter gracilis RM3268 TaxID=553220 RepID=C8PJ73_9BACT|nr:hypothetical protein CAMGR0001_1272 [Campylobacter gracilis RM3268]
MLYPGFLFYNAWLCDDRVPRSFNFATFGCYHTCTISSDNILSSALA